MTSPKLQILSQVSEIEILKFYLPTYDPKQTSNYKSPFSETDEKPSLAIYTDAQGLKFKSHNTGHQGDVFQFVADLKAINCKANFNKVLSAIAQDMKLNFGEVAQKESLKLSFNPDRNQLETYFAGYGIDPETLRAYNVNAIKYHEFTNGKGKVCKFDYLKTNNLAVCYSVDERIKVYFPQIDLVQEKSFGFKNQTTAQIFGLDQLIAKANQARDLYISAGEKDCLSLNARGLSSICFQSENTYPTKAQIDQLNTLRPNIFIVYDSDTAGITASKKLADLTKWKQIVLPSNFKDVADYFKVNSKIDFLALTIDKSSDKKEELETTNVFHQSEYYLSKNFDIRFNTIKLDIEIKPKGSKTWQDLNENDLYVEMNKRGIKVSIDKLISILKSNFVKRFNPLINYFESLPKADTTDHIANLAKHLHTKNDEQLQMAFKKWLIRCVRCAIEPQYFNKQAFILIHSKQNSGKTSFCRFLCPPSLGEYIAENLSDDKDSRIALSKNFIINLDELASLARHEINSLKTLFSKDCINERLPYERKASIIPRVANFIGSTNMAEFLTDETGSVRWLCFEISKIDWAYKQNIDIDKVWSQAYSLYKNGYNADMSAKEIEENEVRNNKFQQKSTEAELIPTLLEPSTEHDHLAKFMTATDILILLSQKSGLKLNKIMVGRAMPSAGFSRVKESKTDRYGYWCIVKDELYLGKDKFIEAINNQGEKTPF